MDYNKLLKVAEYFERKAQAYSGETKGGDTEGEIRMYAKEFAKTSKDPNLEVTGVFGGPETFNVTIRPSPYDFDIHKKLEAYLNSKLTTATVNVSYAEKYSPEGF